MDLSVQLQETLVGVEVNFVVGSNPHIAMSYTCHGCAGYGSPCRTPGCYSGRITENHTMASLGARIGEPALANIVNALKSLCSRE